LGFKNFERKTERESRFSRKYQNFGKLSGVVVELELKWKWIYEKNSDSSFGSS
jgi:hypothetical protein